MQIRKGLLAAATAATVSISGIAAVPAFAADEKPAPTTTTKTEAPKEEPKKETAAPKTETKPTTDQAEENRKKELELKERELTLKEQEQERKNAQKAEEDRIRKEGTFQEKSSLFAKDAFTKDGQPDPAKITAWIGVFTAILGAIGTLIAFVQKNFNIKF